MLAHLLSIAVTASTVVGFQKPQNLKLELLVFKDCPNSPKMRSNVEATLRKLKWKLTVRSINIMKLPIRDSRRGYGAPTLLVNGKDLFGQARNRSGAASCRIYADGGVPSVTQIEAALNHNNKVSGSSKKGSSRKL